jgi:hypothetical protein
MLSMFEARPRSMLETVNPAAETVNSQRVEKTRVTSRKAGS